MTIEQDELHKYCCHLSEGGLVTGDLHPMSVLARGGPVVVPPPEVGGKQLVIFRHGHHMCSKV